MTNGTSSINTSSINTSSINTSSINTSSINTSSIKNSSTLIIGFIKGRSYIADIPSGYDSAKKYPVVIGMGGWQDANVVFRGYSGLKAEVGREAIILYPQAAVSDFRFAWGGAPYSRTTVHSDASFIRAALNDLASRYSVNRDKVFAVGLSNGGGMAIALACHAPDLVAGVAGVAGAYYNPTTNNCSQTPVPALIMHAPNDDVVGYNGGTRHGAPFRSIDAVVRQFQIKNNCSVSGISGTGTVGSGTTTYTSAGCSAPTKHIRVENGGHNWFPGLAQREVWSFFKSII